MGMNLFISTNFSSFDQLSAAIPVPSLLEALAEIVAIGKGPMDASHKKNSIGEMPAVGRGWMVTKLERSNLLIWHWLLYSEDMFAAIGSHWYHTIVALVLIITCYICDIGKCSEMADLVKPTEAQMADDFGPSWEHVDRCIDGEMDRYTDRYSDFRHIS